MATIAQVRSAARKNGCYFRVDFNMFTLYAPDGFAFEGEYPMIGRESDTGYFTKADIYDEMLDAMDDIRKESK